jgi:hypothetical protein
LNYLILPQGPRFENLHGHFLQVPAGRSFFLGKQTVSFLNLRFEGLEQAQPLKLPRALLVIIIVCYRVRREARAALELARITSLDLYVPPTAPPGYLHGRKLPASDAQDTLRHGRDAQGRDEAVLASPVGISDEGNQPQTIARKPAAVARFKALVQSGVINLSTMWQKTGTVAINGWQAFSAHYGIAANDAKEAAAKALTKAEADLQVVTEAESLIATEVKDMSGKELATATKLVYVAEPEQPVSRTFINGTKAGGIAFLNSLSLGRSWASLVAPTRIVCLAAQEAATAAVAAANAAALAAVVDHQPPAAPTIVSTGAVTAAAVDVGAMSESERRALLAKLLPAMAEN